MTARQQWSVVGGVVLVLAIALFAATRLLGDELFPVTVGSDAPPLAAVTLDAAKRTKTLADYQDKVVLLNVWATWCEPCRQEMPSIEKLHREFASRGLAVVAVSLDDPGQEEHIREFVAQYHLTFEVLHDPSQRTKAVWQLTGFPETFLVGRDGKIRRKVFGATDWSSESNRALIRGLVGTATASR